MVIMIWLIIIIVLSCIFGEILYRNSKRKDNMKNKQLEDIDLQDAIDRDYPEHNETLFINRFH